MQATPLPTAAPQSHGSQQAFHGAWGVVIGTWIILSLFGGLYSGLLPRAGTWLIMSNAAVNFMQQGLQY